MVIGWLVMQVDAELGSKNLIFFFNGSLWMKNTEYTDYKFNILQHEKPTNT